MATRIVFLCTVLWTSCAFADDAAPFYASASLDGTHVKNRLNQPEMVSSPTVGAFRMGYLLNPYVGVEGEGILGLADSSVAICNGGSCSSAQSRVNSQWGAMVRFQLPLSRWVPYLRIGGAQLRVETSSSSQQLDLRQSMPGLVFGAGLGVHIDHQRQIFLDVEHLKSTSGSIDVFGLGYSQSFSFADGY